MVSGKRRIGIAVAFLTTSLLLMWGCSEKSTQEKMAEHVLKQSSGKDVDVKMQKGKVEIDEKGGSKTIIAEATTWPSDMFKDVPQLNSGKIKHVVKSDEQGGIRKFNIYYVDLENNALNNYADILKKNGWQVNVMQMGDKGGMLNAEKGKLVIQLPVSIEDKRGTLIVFNIQ